MAAALKQDEETLDENNLSFHRASHHTTDEVALQSKENNQRENHGDKGTGGQKMPVLSLFTHNRSQGIGNNLVLTTAQEDQPHQIIIPDPQELEDGKGSQGGYG